MRGNRRSVKTGNTTQDPLFSKSSKKWSKNGSRKHAPLSLIVFFEVFVTNTCFRSFKSPRFNSTVFSCYTSISRPQKSPKLRTDKPNKQTNTVFFRHPQRNRRFAQLSGRYSLFEGRMPWGHTDEVCAAAELIVTLTLFLRCEFEDQVLGTKLPASLGLRDMLTVNQWFWLFNIIRSSHTLSKTIVGNLAGTVRNGNVLLGWR